MNKAMEQSAEAAYAGDFFTAGRAFSKPAAELVTVADLAVTTGSALQKVSSAGRMDAAIARMTAAESRFALIATAELRELLISMEMEGIMIPGEVVEVGAGDSLIGRTRQHGGAFHDLSSGTTYVNLDQVKAQLAKTGLKTPQQVLLHEFGHYGQSTKLKTNAQGDPLQSAYFEREAAASEKGATLAKEPGDVAALKAHAAENRKVVKMLNQP